MTISAKSYSCVEQTTAYARAPQFLGDDEPTQTRAFGRGGRAIDANGSFNTTVDNREPESVALRIVPG
jgi:hypothetical protein